MPEKVIMSWSGGKDSALALHHVLQSSEYTVTALLTTINEVYDRVSIHGVRRSLLQQQAEALGIPLRETPLSNQASNEEYETKLAQTLLDYKQQGITKVVFGDIFLEDLRAYREKNLQALGMTGIFPLWKQETSQLAHSYINAGFQGYVVCVDSKVLDPTFVGRAFDATLLADLPESVDPCGENGEFHSFTFAGPIFNENLKVTTGEIVHREPFYFCDLL
jgi:uncharacterized protein (TIGR00290 family)